MSSSQPIHPTQSTHAVATRRAELLHGNPVCVKVQFSLLRSLPVDLAAIPERFSSSSLPPSFAPGRRAAVFTPKGIAIGDALCFSAGR
jgi:hypothetical protein